VVLAVPAPVRSELATFAAPAVLAPVAVLRTFVGIRSAANACVSPVTAWTALATRAAVVAAAPLLLSRLLASSAPVALAAPLTATVAALGVMSGAKSTRICCGGGGG
jgi:hypothetical protein